MNKTEEREIQQQLARLQQEHRDLDAAIASLQASPLADISQIQRLKKRKLFLRERIDGIQGQLEAVGLEREQEEGVMEIENEGLPYSGEPFRFTVLGTTDVVTIEAYVNSVLIQTEECPDPPCHEIVQIPPGTRNSTLRLVATDRTGSTVEREFKIGESESGAAVAQ